MYQVIIIEGNRHEVVGNHPSLEDAIAAFERCVACVKQFHFAILNPDGSLHMLAAGPQAVRR